MLFAIWEISQHPGSTAVKYTSSCLFWNFNTYNRVITLTQMVTALSRTKAKLRLMLKISVRWVLMFVWTARCLTWSMPAAPYSSVEERSDEAPRPERSDLRSPSLPVSPMIGTSTSRSCWRSGTSTAYADSGFGAANVLTEFTPRWKTKTHM